MFGYLMQTKLIHTLASLCTTTRCSPHLRSRPRITRHLRDLRTAFCARSCKRASENTPSTSLGELRASPGPYHLISSGVQDFACVRNPIQTLVVADLIATGPTMKIVRVLVACLVVEVYKDIVAPPKWCSDCT